MARHREVWGQRETPAVEAVQPQVGVADSVAAVEQGLAVTGGLPAKQGERDWAGVVVNIGQMVIAQPSSIQQFSVQRKRFGPRISGVGRSIEAM